MVCLFFLKNACWTFSRHIIGNLAQSNTEENGATGNGGEPVRTPEKGGDLGGSKDGTHSDGYEKEKAGMVRARQ